MRKVRRLTRSPGRPTPRAATGPRSRPQSTRRAGQDTQIGLHEIEHCMDATVSIDLADPLPRAELLRLADDVFAWLQRVDRLFNMYRPDSEISRMRRGELRMSESSPEVRTALERCAELWRATGGFFDPYATGVLDPSGFVKGWAIQVASDRLLAAGCDNHCLTCGGDVRVRGTTAVGEPWRIGVRHPWERLEVAWVLAGTDLAVATSGSYGRGPHVIDPYQGRPATQLRSVTVVGHDLGTATAYATAGTAMGLPALTWLARLDGHEAAVVTEDGRRFRSDGLPVSGEDAWERR